MANALGASVGWLIAPLWLLDAIDTDTVSDSTGVHVGFVALIALPWIWTIAVITTVIARDDDRGPHELIAGTTQNIS